MHPLRRRDRDLRSRPCPRARARAGRPRQNLTLSGSAARSGSGTAATDAYFVALYLPPTLHGKPSPIVSKGPAAFVYHVDGANGPALLQSDFQQGYDTFCRHHACFGFGSAEFGRLKVDAQDVKPGDTLTYTVASNGLSVAHDGRTTLTIPDATFAHNFARALLGRTSAFPPAFRSALLGQG